jgi:hypothetical protein
VSIFVGSGILKGKWKGCEKIVACFSRDPIKPTINEPKKKRFESQYVKLIWFTKINGLQGSFGLSLFVGGMVRWGWQGVKKCQLSNIPTIKKNPHHILVVFFPSFPLLPCSIVCFVDIGKLGANPLSNNKCDYFGYICGLFSFVAGFY